MRIETKLIRTEKFSNRNFYIQIDLYEHGLARGRCECKRIGIEKKMDRWSCSVLYFPSYSWMSIVEWEEFYGCFTGDKIARRWVRRVMQHSFKGFLKNDGNIDHTQFAIEDDKRNAKSREYYRMNKEQLLLMKQLLPEFFHPGTFRTGVQPYTHIVLEASSKEKYKTVPPRILNHPILYRKWLQARMRYEDKLYFWNNLIIR